MNQYNESDNFANSEDCESQISKIQNLTLSDFPNLDFENLNELLSKFRIEKNYRPTVTICIYLKAPQDSDKSFQKILQVQSNRAENERAGWSLLQGGIEENENEIFKTVFREIYEETKLTPDDFIKTSLRFVSYNWANAKPGRRLRDGYKKGKAFFNFSLELKPESENNIQIDPSELKSYRFVEGPDQNFFDMSEPKQEAVLLAAKFFKARILKAIK